MQVQTERVQQLDPANMERAMRAMFGLGRYLEQAGLEESLLHLVTMRASQTNGCAFCIDMHTKDARARGETEQRLYIRTSHPAFGGRGTTCRPSVPVPGCS